MIMDFNPVKTKRISGLKNIGRGGLSLIKESIGLNP
jgi:hypothetical protein